VQTAVADYYAQNGSFPAAGVTTTTSGIGMTAVPAGKYASVNLLAGGSVQITYNGPNVNTTISGKKLGLGAGLSANGDIVWVCGSATAPASLATPPAASTTDLVAKYLPSSCK
jgi:type IV pilus assembly protein PilA